MGYKSSCKDCHKCSSCKGTGKDWYRCSWCRGSGHQLAGLPIRNCSTCGGSGFMRHKCNTCDGRGGTPCTQHRASFGLEPSEGSNQAQATDGPDATMISSSHGEPRTTCPS